MEEKNYIVFIKCPTYNQASYIEDAMNGFCMQETNFPFVCTIIDDASTDGEQKVIMNYLQEHFDLEDKSVVRNEETDDYTLWFARHRTNHNCYFAVLYLKYNHYRLKKDRYIYVETLQKECKYIAVCEGDDYWIDKHKLQRQVDFLETHPDYMMHFHNALVRYQNHDRPDRLISTFETGDFNMALLFEKWQLPMASVLFRKEILNSQVYQELIKVYHGGFCLFIASSRTGKVYGLSECLSVYRKNDGGIANGFSAAYCMQLDYGFAKASGDKDAMKVMDRRATQALTGRILPYFRKNPEAVEMVKVVDSFNKHVFYHAFWKYVLSIPLRVIKKIRK